MQGFQMYRFSPVRRYQRFNRFFLLSTPVRRFSNKVYIRSQIYFILDEMKIEDMPEMQCVSKKMR
jgi:hypothetical protein